MTPFWWDYSKYLNDNVLTYQIDHFRHFTDQIPFSKLTNLAPAEIKCTKGSEGYAMGSDQVIFGWIVNCKTDVAGVTVTLPSVANGNYKLRLYHTWRGEFIMDKDIEVKKHTATFDMPVLKITGGHAKYLGQDVAFILQKKD